jgi:Flp pilus assembly protein TadG
MRDRRRGNTIIEAAMLMPIILLLLVGMGQLAKITYTYYTLKKTVYSVASYLSTQQGVNFCDPADPTVTAAINFGLTGTTDNSQPVFVTGLTADMLQVTPEAVDPTTGVPGSYTSACSGALNFAGAPPDQIVVSIPNGYTMTMRIPFLPQTSIPLKPTVKVPYGGT